MNLDPRPSKQDAAVILHADGQTSLAFVRGSASAYLEHLGRPRPEFPATKSGVYAQRLYSVFRFLVFAALVLLIAFILVRVVLQGDGGFFLNAAWVTAVSALILAFVVMGLHRRDALVSGPQVTEFLNASLAKDREHLPTDEYVLAIPDPERFSDEEAARVFERVADDISPDLAERLVSLDGLGQAAVVQETIDGLVRDAALAVEAERKA